MGLEAARQIRIIGLDGRTRRDFSRIHDRRDQDARTRDRGRQANIPRVEEQADLLSTFAKMRQEASEALAGAADEQLHQTWTRMSRPCTSFRRDRC